RASEVGRDRGWLQPAEPAERRSGEPGLQPDGSVWMPRGRPPYCILRCAAVPVGAQAELVESKAAVGSRKFKEKRAPRLTRGPVSCRGIYFSPSVLAGFSKRRLVSGGSDTVSSLVD